MLEGLYSSAAGMAAQQEQLNAIGNDLANLSTSGYKAERVAFGDLHYNAVTIAGTETTVGAGASARSLGRLETEGSLHQTGNPLDLAIEGEGFFEVALPGGQTGLTRNGALQLDAAGHITDGQGNILQPPIAVPAGVSESQLRVSADGTVSASGRTLGRISLVTVPAPDQLLGSGEGTLLPGVASGAPVPASGQLRQGALEESNVDLGREMTALITSQRAFQMDSSAIQTENQMLSIANQLRT